MQGWLFKNQFWCQNKAKEMAFLLVLAKSSKPSCMTDDAYTEPGTGCVGYRQPVCNKQ
jgi:hypothetical protein